MPSDRIPVVIAAPPMRTGGTERHLLHVLPALEERGFDVTAVLLGPGGALEPALRERLSRVMVPTLGWPRPFRTLDQARMIRGAVRNTGARIVHAFLSEPYIAASLAQRTLTGSRPHLVHGRRSLAFYGANHRFAQKVEVAAHRLASALVGNSRAVTNELMQEAGGDAKVCLIPNGIPLCDGIAPAERAAARAAFGLPADALVLSLVANLHVYKGHADLIAALALIRDKLPGHWRLLLVGRDGGERERVLAEIDRAGLKPHVVAPGEWPGSREPYAAADIGLLVSHTEGFSNSLIEGMAAGLPMIATRVGGNPDAIDDGETGFLVAPHAPDELANAILTLAGMPDLREKLGTAARRKALSAFSLEACVDRYEQLWRGLAEGRPGRPADWLAGEPAIRQSDAAAGYARPARDPAAG
jgi:glycosyltransferase involved in cell wall biosynthesis